MLEINNAVVSVLDLRELLKTISPCLRQIIHHDFAALLLYDSGSSSKLWTAKREAFSRN
ncbi:MAG TPA: hypothetical protein VM943_08165 [Pyrinomonadaceae bacterium]|nr:hypothetical protein [Pyrinomonadaceae bacterium]